MNSALFDELGGLPGAEVAPSQWTNEQAIWVDGREIVHAHERWIEIRLTASSSRAWTTTAFCAAHAASDWVMVDEAERDLILALAPSGGGKRSRGCLVTLCYKETRGAD